MLLSWMFVFQLAAAAVCLCEHHTPMQHKQDCAEDNMQDCAEDCGEDKTDVTASSCVAVRLVAICYILITLQQLLGLSSLSCS